MNLTAILGICIISASVVTLLKNYKSEYAMIVALTAGAIILVYLVFELSDRLLTLRNFVSEYGVDTSYFLVALKALGICVITGFVADACRDAGQSSLALKAELAGRCAVFILSIPLLTSLLQTAYGFIG